MSLSAMLMEGYYAIPAVPGYCLNPCCTKSRNKQYTERGYVMHMKASPSCCRFALNLGKQLTRPRGNYPSMIGDKKKPSSAEKKATNPPPADDHDYDDDEEEKPITMTSSIRDDNSTISALTDIQYEAEPTPEVAHCPNPNCPKNQNKLYSGQGYMMHMKASPSCNAYFLIALWYQYRHLNDDHGKKLAQRTLSDDESSMIASVSSNDCSVHSDDDPDAGQHACPNPNCPMSKSRRYTNDEYTVHMHRSTSCFRFIVIAVRDHQRVVSPIQE